jgi:hypothetical protein
VPGRGDTLNLLPLYTAAYGRIRSVDPAHIVMVEPSVLEVYFGQQSGLGPGLIGGAGDVNQAFAYHTYCVNQNASGDIVNVTACADTLQWYWGTERANKARIGAGSFLTEFGAVGPNPSSAEVSSCARFRAGAARRRQDATPRVRVCDAMGPPLRPTGVSAVLRLTTPTPRPPICCRGRIPPTACGDQAPYNTLQSPSLPCRVCTAPPPLRCAALTRSAPRRRHIC